MWSVTHVTKWVIIPTSALIGSGERLWALVKKESPGARITKPTRTAPRSAGTCMHLKDQSGGRKKGKGKQQSNARSAETAGSGSSGTPSGAQLQEMFQAFMLTQNAASASPRREDSYSGSVLELKVPLTPMSDTDQTRIHAGATPWRSPTLQARVAAATLTRKGPERQRLAGPQSKMPLGFLQQGPLTARLRGGGEGPEKEPEIDAEAVSKGEGEPDETMPEPEEPAGTKPGLQVLPGTKNGSPGGRQTRSMTDALLRVDDTEVGKSKSSVVMPKGFGELPRTDPQYQGIQGFNFGDFPPLGGGVSKETTSNITKGAGEAPSEDMEIVKQPEEEVELESGQPLSQREGKRAYGRSGRCSSHSCSRLACKSAGSPCAADQPPYSLPRTPIQR
jgi:hypothetical protein